MQDDFRTLGVVVYAPVVAVDAVVAPVVAVAARAEPAGLALEIRDLRDVLLQRFVCLFSYLSMPSCHRGIPREAQAV